VGWKPRWNKGLSDEARWASTRGNGFESRWGYQAVLGKPRNHAVFLFGHAELVTFWSRTQKIRANRRNKVESQRTS